MSIAEKRASKRPPLTAEQRCNSLLPSHFQTTRRIVGAIGYEPVTPDGELAADMHDALIKFDIRRAIKETPSDKSLKSQILDIETVAEKLANARRIENGENIADGRPAVWFALSRRKPVDVEDRSEMVLNARHLYQAAKSFRINPDPDEIEGVPRFPEGS